MTFKFLTTIPDVWKAAGVMGAIFVGGLGLGATAIGWTKVPEKIANLEVRMAQADEDRASMQSELRQVRSLIQQQLCLTVAEKQHTPWQNCVKPEDLQRTTPR